MLVSVSEMEGVQEGVTDGVVTEDGLALMTDMLGVRECEAVVDGVFEGVWLGISGPKALLHRSNISSSYSWLSALWISSAVCQLSNPVPTAESTSSASMQ